MTTGLLIKAARKKANMTQAQLAAKTGINYQCISKWECGKRNPKYETLSRIADALGIDVNCLIPGSDTTWHKGLVKMGIVAKAKGLTDVDVRVVLAYAENDMNVTETGKKLFMHRNTVQYHLDVAGKKTGLNPMKFYDLQKLICILKPSADVIELGSCEGCYWKGMGRFQKCTYCRRNRKMKDFYIVGRE